MDWEANLAAIIKCTDANLEQQFRQFADMTADLTTYGQDPHASAAFSGGAGGGLQGYFQQTSPFDDGSNNNIGAAYFRETMASNQRHHGGTPTRLSTSFSDHFRKRQERKRSDEVPPQRRDRSTPSNNAADGSSSERFENDDHDGLDYEEEISKKKTNGSAHQHARRHRSSATHGMPYQMYNSPTYDMAQMMEQVRLSLKLEVDARAAIAERQLSALLQLCKTSTDEMDRLRVEVCANDRQIHTLEQVQSKLRQELTTQKDIGFHLQSMCGKDESWRMQAENQLLELRQMVATIREQGNSLHATSQEKLSRAELLVQFNAAMEPIKAQLQANIQHQAQQIAEITRTTSSSSLLLDALTQKVNRGVTDEVSELRNELYALKSHVAKVTAMWDSRSVQQEQLQPTPPQLSPPAKDPAADEQERARLKAKRKTELLDELQAHVLSAVDDRMGVRMNDLESRIMLQLGKAQAKQGEECVDAHKQCQTSCQARAATLSTHIEGQLKAVQQQFQGEWSSHSRDVSDKMEQVKQQLTTTTTALVDARASACQTRQIDLLKMIECEQKERKQSLESVHESCRNARHSLEDQMHTLTHENRTKSSQLLERMEIRVKELEKHTTHASDAVTNEMQTRLDAFSGALEAQNEALSDKLTRKAKVCEESVAKLGATVSSLSASVDAVKASASEAVSTAAANARSEDRNVHATSTCASSSSSRATAEKETSSAYLTAMDAMLQKMQLQLQTQAQQAQMAMQQPPMYPPYWMPSPHHYVHSPSAPSSIYPTPATVPTLSQSPSLIVHSSGTTTVPATMPDMKQEPRHNSDGDSDAARDAPSAAAVSGESAKAPSVETVGADNPSHAGAVADRMVDSSDGGQQESDVVKSTAQHIPSLPHAAPAVTPVVSIQQTMAATAKGALAEAEMAKLRVETRRKQELEMRQQQSDSSALSPPPIRSSTSHALPASIGEPSQLVASASARNPPPHLSCAASTSALLFAASESIGIDKAASNAPLPRPRSNSISGVLVDSQVGPAPPSPLDSSAQQKTTQPSNAAQPPSSPATLLSSPMGKPPPPSPLIPRPAVSSSEAKAIPNVPTSSSNSSTLDSPRIPPPAPALAPSASALSPESPPVTAQPMSSRGSNNALPSAPHGAMGSAESTAPTIPGKPSTPLQQSSATAGYGAKPPPPSSYTPSVAAPAPPPHLQPPPSLAPSPNAQSTSVSTPSHILCRLCRLPIRSDLQQEHERTQCSKRTEECASCGTKVLWSEIDAHTKACPLAAATSSSANGGAMKKCRHCAADVLSPDLFDHELRCDKMLKQCPHCLRRQKMADLQDHIENCDCRLVPCPNNCGGKFLQRGIPKHLATRCPNKSSSPVAAAGVPTTANIATPVLNPSSSTSAPAVVPTAPPISATAVARSQHAPANAVKTECKFCDEEFPGSEIDDHEDKCDWKPKRCQHCNMVIIARDLGRHEASCKTSQKNCPHCNEHMPQSALAAHTARCSKRPIKCIRCCQQFPADSIVAHSTKCKFVPSASSGALSTPPAATPASPSVKIPPPPPYPPTPLANNASTKPSPATSAPSSSGAAQQAKPSDIDESLADRIARRNLALSQLTKPPTSAVPLSSGSTTTTAIPSLSQTSQGLGRNALHGSIGSGPERDDEDRNIDEDEDEEEEDDEDEDQLTLAQVVGEWNVENVCLWLHEDVGVPEVVPRFQQRRCNGEMLLDLTESDLINDFGVKNRIHRERILNAIEAIKTSDDFSDEEEDEEDDEEDEEDDDDEEEDDAAATQQSARSSLGEGADVLLTGFLCFTASFSRSLVVDVWTLQCHFCTRETYCGETRFRRLNATQRLHLLCRRQVLW